MQMDSNSSADKHDVRQCPNGQAPAGKVWVIVCAILLSAACAEFLSRGALRATSNSGDFAVFYTGARAWAYGTNPYDLENLKRVARQAGGVPENSLHTSSYPPATFVILAPVSLLPWGQAKVVWAAINTIAIFMLAYGVVTLAGLRVRSPLGMLLAAAVLGLSPIHTGVHVGQLTPLLAACLALAYLLDDKRRIWLGGVLLALVTAMKPQIGLVFIAFEGVRTRFKVVSSALLFTGTIFVVALGWLAINGVEWWQSWYNNYHSFMYGGAGDPTAVNASRFQLLNLHYPLSMFIDNRAVVQIITLSFVGMLGVAAVIVLSRHRTRNAELLGMSIFGVLSLLVVYHRYYSAILLAFPLAWAILQCRRGLRVLPMISLVIMAVFLVPSASILDRAVGKGIVPASVADSWWWQGLVMPHQVYALVALSICLVTAIFVETPHRQPTDAAGSD